MPTTTDRIEKEIVLRAPRARVWRALTDAAEFGTWFGVKMEGAFAPKTRVRGASPSRATSTSRWRWRSSAWRPSACSRIAGTPTR
jgi:uncharacterized protein YndB with AHSA1/START domain